MNDNKTEKNDLNFPEIGLGCMRITSLARSELEKLIKTAIDLGINLFDHADIYAGGAAESHFAAAAGMNSALREKMILQTKCSIKPGLYDCSAEHIISSVDNSLTRLGTDYIDLFLLHRPDALTEPAEVAQAFGKLKKQGKVRHFGVSNHNSGQIALLNKYCANEIAVNQLQLSITNCGMIDAGLNVNVKNDLAVDRDGAILDYCRLNGIKIQAWSPFQYGLFEGVFIGNGKFPKLNDSLDRLAAKYDVTSGAIAAAWILRHPAGIEPIVGTTNVQRLADIARAKDVTLTRQEWYELYLSTGKKLQ